MSGDTKKSLSLTSDTFIPLSFIGVIFGAAYWLNGLNSRIEVAEERIESYDSSQSHFEEKLGKHLEVQDEMLSGIKSQISAIDARLDMLIRSSRKPPGER